MNWLNCLSVFRYPILLTFYRSVRTKNKEQRTSRDCWHLRCISYYTQSFKRSGNEKYNLKNGNEIHAEVKTGKWLKRSFLYGWLEKVRNCSKRSSDGRNIRIVICNARSLLRSLSALREFLLRRWDKTVLFLNGSVFALVLLLGTYFFVWVSG